MMTVLPSASRSNARCTAASFSGSANAETGSWYQPVEYTNYPDAPAAAEGTTAHDVAQMGGDNYILELDASVYDSLSDTDLGKMKDSTALVFVTRSGNENADKKSDGYTDGTEHFLQLSKNERDMIAFAKESCKKVVVYGRGRVGVIIAARERDVTLKVKEVADYNFKDLFVVSIDGEKTDISDEMVTSDVKAEVGTYSYTVTLGDTSKTIVVEVIEDHVIDVVNSYKTKTITLSEVENFDATELFSLTVDGVAKKVTANMIDVSGLKAEEGKYLVTLTYKEDSTVVTSSVEVVVVADHELALSGKNVTIYPNSERLDVTSLFSLKIDGVEHNELISLLDITGSIDYSRLGENTLTLNYGGKTATAVVTIATGAHLEVTKSDVIIIKKGTSMDEYSFNNDVILISNGQRFVVANRYIDTSKVDFSAAGSYEVVVKVPYKPKYGEYHICTRLPSCSP